MPGGAQLASGYAQRVVVAEPCCVSARTCQWGPCGPVPKVAWCNWKAFGPERRCHSTSSLTPHGVVLIYYVFNGGPAHAHKLQGCSAAEGCLHSMLPARDLARHLGRPLIFVFFPGTLLGGISIWGPALPCSWSMHTHQQRWEGVVNCLHEYQVPEDAVAQQRASAPFEGLRYQLLAAAFRLHQQPPQSLRDFHYHFPDYERLIMWKVGTLRASGSRV